MREIKFRGKRIDNGKWVYGYFIKWDGKSHIYEDKGDLLQKAVEVIPETVGQYTGLKDKNGKEGYAGDIIRDQKDSNKIIYWNTSEGRWQFRNKRGDWLNIDFYFLIYMETTGNIHEGEINAKE